MKQRLDTFLVEKKLVKSRSQASDLIKRGKVHVQELTSIKPSTLVEETMHISIDEDDSFVSRGGLKLAHALTIFNINPHNKICLDIGSSTGGFTDCLLQHGANKVYAVDVGTNQFSNELKKDPRVVLYEKTDIREAHIPEKVDITVIDVSFISLSLILPHAHTYTHTHGDIIALIKPQFEVGKENLPKTGVVTDTNMHTYVIEKIKTHGTSLGLSYQHLTESPVLGGSGNKEFLIHFKNTQ